MKRSETTNTFQEGLVMDFNPLNTPSGTLSNCLNGTLITFNGDEYVLQNDMGNGRVETASLPQGYVPLGTAELGGIIYIVSYNPLIDRCQIGSFPSPERNIAKEEIPDSPIASEVTNKNFVNDKHSVTSTLVKVKLLDNMKLNPGDKFIIYGNNISDNKNSISDIGSTSHKIDSIPRYVTIRVVSIGDDGKITYLDDSLKWAQLSDSEGNSVGDYYIKQNDLSQGSIKADIDSYNKLVSSAYNVFKSKVSGQLALLFELKTIDSFTATWSATVSNYEGEGYEKQGNIFVDLNWTSQFSSLNPKAAKITDAKVTGNVGLLLSNGTILSDATEIQNYLNSLTYTFKVDKANTVIASPKSIIVNKPTINVNKPIKPEISQSIQEAKQKYIDQEFEAELAIKDIITLNGEYLRANDGTDKPTSVMVGKFLYNTEENPENSSTISFTVTPIMPYGDLPYLSVSNTINLLDVGTGKVTISRWKYFVNDSQTFIDFGINAYPEMGCSIDKVSLIFISMDNLEFIASNWNDESLNMWNTDFEDNILGIFPKSEQPYIYELPQQASYSGQHNITILPENISLDTLHLVDICARYQNPNNVTGSKTTFKHNFRWLFTSKQFNDFYLQSDVIDFNNIHLSDTINPEISLQSYDSINVRTDSYFPNLALDEMPDDGGKFSAMGVNVYSINYTPNKGLDRKTPNYQVKTELKLDNRLLSIDNQEYFHNLQQEEWSYKILDSKLSTNIDNIQTNVVYPQINPELIIEDDQALEEQIKFIPKVGIEESRYTNIVDQFEITPSSITENSIINFNIRGAAFGKINSSIIQKQMQVDQTIRPLLLYSHEYSKFGFKVRTDSKALSGSPILKYLYGEGHRDIGGGDPFKFSFAYVDAEQGLNYSSVYSNTDPSDSDNPKPIRSHSSSKNNWDPGDTFYNDNYWDDTPPYTNYLNNWMLNVGGPFQFVLYNRYNQNVDGTLMKIYDKTLKKDLSKNIVLYVRTSNNHYVPIDCSDFWESKKDQFYQRISLNLASILMQIYYVDTTPSFVTKYIPNEINSIDYNETISFKLEVKVPLKSEILTNCININVPSGTYHLTEVQSWINGSISELDINSNNIYISDSINRDLSNNATFNHIIKIDTTNLYDYFNQAKTLSINARYIVPSTCFNNYSGEDGKMHHGISEGYIQPINPTKLYVIDTPDFSSIRGFKELNTESLSFQYANYICTYQKDIFDDKYITDPFNGGSSTLYLIATQKLTLQATDDQKKIFEALIWRDGDTSFDEDKLLASSERREFYYHTQASGDGTGAYYKSNSRYQFPNIFE